MNPSQFPEHASIIVARIKERGDAMTRFICFSAAAFLLATALPASATDIYCTVVGAKQGKFQGDPGLNGDTTQIHVYALTEEIKIPFDAASGQSTGKAQHSPIIISKELDASSPQFFTSVVNNEALRLVTCTLYRTTNDGVSRPYYKIALTNASIVEIKDSGNGVNGTQQSDEKERISFTYQKIEWTDLTSNTTATDDWTSPN
jgi:type VI secretion system secreted protein Hcp